jgi:hypothetical protein
MKQRLSCSAEKSETSQKEKGSLTFKVQLKSSVLSAQAIEELLGGVAVGAVRLGEDNDSVVVDELLGAGLCGGHCGGIWTGEGAE